VSGACLADFRRPSRLGRDRAKAALERGDRDALAASDVAALEELADAYGDAAIPIGLDASHLRRRLAAALERLGRFDVVVNAPERGHYGAVEEIAEAEARRLMDVDSWHAAGHPGGAAQLREQRGGHIVQVSCVCRDDGLVAGHLPCLKVGAGGVRSCGPRRSCFVVEASNRQFVGRDSPSMR
jgi:NAD(P)-dependent dehydrogenase (short-subunit alcohol dehydrogenase family)